MQYSSIILALALSIALSPLAVAQPWEDEDFLLSISTLVEFQKADCSQSIHDFEMLAQDQEGTVWFVQHVSILENLAWTFLISHWIDLLTGAHKPSIKIFLGIEQHALAIRHAGLRELCSFERFVGDFDIAGSYLYNAEIDTRLYFIFLYFINIVRNGSEIHYRSSLLDSEYPKVYSQEEKQRVQSKLDAAKRVLDENGLEAGYKWVLYLLKEYNPQVYAAFAQDITHQEVNKLIERIGTLLGKELRERSETSKVCDRDPDAIVTYLERVFDYFSKRRADMPLSLPFVDFMLYTNNYKPLRALLIARLEDPRNHSWLAEAPMEFVEGFLVHPRWLPLLGFMIARGVQVDQLRSSEEETLLHRALANRNYEASEFIMRLWGESPDLYRANTLGQTPAYYPWFHADIKQAQALGDYPKSIFPLASSENARQPIQYKHNCEDTDSKDTQRAQEIYLKLVAAAEQLGFQTPEHNFEVVFSPLNTEASVDSHGVVRVSKYVLQHSDEAVAFILGHELGHVLRGDMQLAAPQIAHITEHNHSLAVDFFGTVYEYPHDSLFFAEHVCDSIGVLVAMAAGYDLGSWIGQPFYDNCASDAEIIDFIRAGLMMDNHPAPKARDRHIWRVIKLASNALGVR